MARSGQAFFARYAIVGLVALGGCAGGPADGTSGLTRNADGDLELVPDAASRERQERLDRRRQDEQIQREIYNWLPRGPVRRDS